ncbi:hypothetical protein CBS101457_004404 [Exobasidium rhododendri]|nr:hypothetical protein CBS101457_004404 [Exobasidium rhododendri]
MLAMATTLSASTAVSVASETPISVPVGTFNNSSTAVSGEASSSFHAQSQPVASTSAVTLDEPVLTNAASLTTSETSMKVTPEPQYSAVNDEDEDAKLLASLASTLSTGDQTLNQADSQTLLAALNQEMPPLIKSESFADPQVSAPTTGAISAGMEDPSGPIQAYAKLEFPGFSYYLQTLSCTIGRRPAHMRTPALQEGEKQHITGAKKLEGDVDVDLGLLKSISRCHVRIFYQDQPRQNALHHNASDMLHQRPFPSEASGSSGRFVLQVLGRNGAFVDDVLVLKDSIVPLGKRTKIQIAERVFYFVLPPTPLGQTYNSDGELESEGSLEETDEEEESESLGSTRSDEESSGLSSVEEGDSAEEVNERGKAAELKKRPKLVLKKKPVPPAIGGKGKGKYQGKTIWDGKGKKPANKGRAPEIDEEDAQDDDVDMLGVEDEEGNEEQRKPGRGKKIKLANFKKEARDKVDNLEVGTAGRKRKRGEMIDEEHRGALKVGTPIGVEALQLKSKKKKKAAAAAAAAAKSVEEQNAIVSSTPDPAVKGKGKGGGKAHIVAAALAAKVKADEQRAKAESTPLASLTSISTSAPTVASAVARPPPIVASKERPIAGERPRPAGELQPSLSSSSSAANVAIRPTGVAIRPPPPSIVAEVHSKAPSTNAIPYQTQAGPPSLSGHLSIRPLAPTTTLSGTSTGATQTFSSRPPPNGITTAPSDAINSPLAAPSSTHLTNGKSASAGKETMLPAGAGIKPDFSNMDLIKTALANATSTNRGGKLTLQEIYEDITGKHEWYRNNNRANGRDWHSSIRHAVGSSREMCRIPRKANEQGKGIFYALNTSEAARVYRLESGATASNAETANPSSTSASSSMAVNAAPAAALAPAAVIPRTLVTTSVAPAATPAVAPAAPGAVARPPSAFSANSAGLPAPSISAKPVAALAPPRPSMPARPPPVARPSPPTLSSGRVTIVIGKAPKEALAQMAAVPKAAITQSIESLFGGPPIVHHEGKLFLSPVVFGHMSASEINDIGGKGAAQALALLQSQLVKHLQSKMSAGQGGTNRPVRPTSTPSTQSTNGGVGRPANTAAAPSPAARPRPMTTSNGATAMSHPVARPMANVPTSQPGRPLQTRPTPAVTAGPSRPPPPTATNLARPHPTASQANGLTGQVRPVISVQQGVRPATAPIHVRPVQSPHQPVSVGSQMQSLPANPLSSSAHVQQQHDQSEKQRPIAGQGVSPSVARPMIATPSPSVSAPSTARPAAAPTPSSAIINTPVASQGTPAGHVAPAPRPMPMKVAGITRPPTTIALATSPAIVVQSAASPGLSFPSALAPVPPSSNAMMSAMQALASHPDAAGLMPLLSGGKMESGTKLTPSQLELLQRVGRIAEEQQKAQQQRRDQAQGSFSSVQTTTSSTSPKVTDLSPPNPTSTRLP